MNKLYISITVICALAGGSCTKDYLDIEPITAVSDQSFYRTPKDAETALVGCYDGLQIIWRSGPGLPMAAEILSDNAFGGGGNSDGLGVQVLDEFDLNRATTNVNQFLNNWNDYYRSVYRCNLLLQKIDQIDWSANPARRNTIEAETRFLRAFFYFDMTRLWGSVPLLTTPTAELVPQAKPDDIYKVIFDDLKFAAQTLPAVGFKTSDAAQGRVTRYAAEALAAKAFLFYTGYYGKTEFAGAMTKADALTFLEDVITNGGYSLVPNFTNLWPAAAAKAGTVFAGEANPEVVFPIKYTYTGDYNGNADGNPYMHNMGIREQSIFPYGRGWGIATVNPKLWNAYSPDDTRRTATVISIVDEKLAFTRISAQREYTGFYQKKYSPMSNEAGTDIPIALGGVNFQINQFQDYYVVRYADVLLMAAELGSPNAQNYFDQVRKRAYGDKFIALPVSFDNIMNERRLEFAFEGIRWFDLLRQGINKAAQEIAETTTIQNGGIATPKVILADKIIATKGLQIIPQTQITLSTGGLVQNPGWQ